MPDRWVREGTLTMKLERLVILGVEDVEGRPCLRVGKLTVVNPERTSEDTVELLPTTPEEAEAVRALLLLVQ